MVVVRTRRRLLGGGKLEPVRGRLPSFARPLGVDVIITEDGRLYLIELQHGFGRQGLLKLFPHENRAYRKTYWRLRRERGGCAFVTEELRRICNDKICTYQHLARHQPSSFAYTGWGPEVERWLDGLESELVLAKPPRGSCGEGIQVLERHALRSACTLAADGVMLLQEFVRSRPLLDVDGAAHVGCIRHIVLLDSDGGSLTFLHLPAYWRVSPLPLARGAEAGALTANISRGAYPVPVDAGEAEVVRALAERVIGELIEVILGLPRLARGRSCGIDAVLA
jgi:hypothetical protein